MKFFTLPFFILLLGAISTRAQTLKDCVSCSTQIIKSSQISDLSIDELRFLTNDLFARKGYKFEAGDINQYYSEKPWYRPIKNNNQVVFNVTEKQNIQLFQDATRSLEQQRKKLLDQLKTFQQLVNADNKETLKQQFSYSPHAKDEFTYLQKAIKKLNLDDLNWFKHQGMYTVTIDNGEDVISFEIKIDKKSIQITYNQQGGSDIAKNTTLYPNEYGISEFAHFWHFEFVNGNLKFIKWDMAG